MCLLGAAGKKPEDQVFDTMDATDLNKRLKDLMDGLSVKVCQLSQDAAPQGCRDTPAGDTRTSFSIIVPIAHLW